MAMLKSLVRSKGGCAQIRRYLERDGRALSFDCSGHLSKALWDSEMDDMRDAWSKDSGRKYYHFIISPDPADNLNAEKVRELALAWIKTNYPDTQWIIETHIDNGVPHAHLVVNAVLPETGRKIHLSNKDVHRDARDLQRLCKERGLRAFDNYDIIRDEDGDWIAKNRWPTKSHDKNRSGKKDAARAQTSSQAWMRQKGIHLWTDDMHKNIEEALKGCRTWKAFERALEEKGYSAKVSSRGVLTFYPPKGEGYPTKGYKLDDSYTIKGIRARFEVSLERTAVKKLIANPYDSRVVKIPHSFSEAAYATARRRHKNGSLRTLQGTFDAIALMQKNGYTNFKQLADASDMLTKRADEVATRLDETRLAYEQTDTAASLIIEREALNARIGKKPRALFEARWSKDNAGEIARKNEIDAWLSAREINPDTRLADIQTMRGALYQTVKEIGEQAHDIGLQAEKVKSAAQAVGALGTSMPIHDRSDVRALERSAKPAELLISPVSQEQFSTFMNKHLRQAQDARRMLVEEMDKARQQSLLLDEQHLRAIKDTSKEQKEGCFAQTKDGDKPRVLPEQNQSRAQDHDEDQEVSITPMKGKRI